MRFFQPLHKGILNVSEHMRFMIFDIVSPRSLSFQVNNSEIFFILNTYSEAKF